MILTFQGCFRVNDAMTYYVIYTGNDIIIKIWNNYSLELVLFVSENAKRKVVYL